MKESKRINKLFEIGDSSSDLVFEVSHDFSYLCIIESISTVLNQNKVNYEDWADTNNKYQKALGVVKLTNSDISYMVINEEAKRLHMDTLKGL